MCVHMCKVYVYFVRAYAVTFIPRKPCEGALALNVFHMTTTEQQQLTCHL